MKTLTWQKPGQQNVAQELIKININYVAELRVKYLIWIIMTAPNIESSTREERLDYVLNEWRCLHNCEICGKCHVLKGRSEEKLYADYIDGKRSYMDITLAIRSNR